MNEILTRTRTYLLPSLVKSYNIPEDKCVSLFLGIKGEKNDMQNVYLWVKDDKNISGFKNKYVFGDDILLEFEYKNKQLYDKIISGQFSKISSKDKVDILNYFNLTNSHKVAQILNKSKMLKKKLEHELNVEIDDELELGEAFEYEKELYNPELSRD